MVEVKRRAPLEVVKYVLDKLERRDIADGIHPVLIHEGQEALDRVEAEIARLRTELAEAHARLAAATASAERSTGQRSKAESKAEDAEERLARMMTRMTEALEWYSEKAVAIERLKDKPEALLAILTELRLDSGKRKATAEGCRYCAGDRYKACTICGASVCRDHAGHETHGVTLSDPRAPDPEPEPEDEP